MDRDSAYRIVQRDARLAWDEAKPLRMVLESDPEVALGPGQLDGLLLQSGMRSWLRVPVRLVFRAKSRSTPRGGRP